MIVIERDFLFPLLLAFFENKLMEHSQALFWSNLGMVVDFGYIYYGCQIKNVSTCVKEKFKFVVNYDKWLKQSRNFHYEA